MRVLVTKDVYRHHTNPNFNCVVVQFEPKDNSYFPAKHNWLPKWFEIEKIIKAFIKCDRDYAQELIGIIRKCLKETEKQAVLGNTLSP